MAAAPEPAQSPKPARARKPRKTETAVAEEAAAPRSRRATKTRAKQEDASEEPKPRKATGARAKQEDASEESKPRKATKARAPRAARTTTRGKKSAEAQTAPEEPEPGGQTIPVAQWKAEPAPVQDEAMTTLYLNVGKRDGVAKAEVSDLLRQHAGLLGDDLGRVRVRDNHTFVGVPAERAEAVIESLSGTALGEVQLTVERARS